MYILQACWYMHYPVNVIKFNVTTACMQAGIKLYYYYSYYVIIIIIPDREGLFICTIKLLLS